MNKILKQKNIISIMIILILCLSILGFSPNEAKAATYIIDEADLYTKGHITCILYKKSILVGVEYVVYKKDGVEYPAYCLDRTLPGITDDVEYTVTVDGLVSNVKIWRAIMNGFPNKTASELGCFGSVEAFAATKLAVYDMMYNYDWDDFEGTNKEGDRVIAAAKKISEAARNSTETKPISIVEIETTDDKWSKDENEGNYASKTFTVTTNVNSTQYEVKLNGVEIENVKITDEENNEKSEFKAGEKFKVLIPISEMDKAGEFEIEVTADMETYPVLYGKSSDPSLQSYALAAGNYEYENAKMTVKYQENTTKIEIIKKDAETAQLLQGAKFNILDEDKNIVYTDVTTDKNGIATVENILPGKYFIEEIKAPNNYTIYDELIEIDVELNQKYTINVNDYKKPENEEKQVEDEDKTVVGKKEINLPRTGF